MAEPEDTHPHLELARGEPVTERRTRPGFRPSAPPDDPQRHGEVPEERLRAAREATASDLGGCDERRPIKIELSEKVPPEAVARASSGLEVVSREDGKLIPAFSEEAQLDGFEARLASLASGGHVTCRNVIHALQGSDRWTPEDRTGRALKRDGVPDEDSFAIDAELWPLASGGESERQRTAFEAWVGEGGVETRLTNMDMEPWYPELRSAMMSPVASATAVSCRSCSSSAAVSWTTGLRATRR